MISRRQLLPFISCSLTMVIGTPSVYSADLILTNGNIHTVNDAQPTAQALVIENGGITFVGSNSDALTRAGANTQVFDLGGKLVLPGFHDVHNHIMEAYSSVNTVQLDAETPLTDLLPKLQGQQPHPATGWVLGGGQSIEQFENLSQLPKDILDQAIPTHPAAMLSASSHSLWANSAALAAAGIDQNTLDPPGGLIERDSNGMPTGLLIDNAGDLIMEVALAPNPQLNDLNYQGLVEGLEFLNSKGVTSMADARVYRTRDHVQIWQRAQTEGTLTTRTNLGLWAYPQFEDAQQLADLTALYDNDPNSLLRVNEIKVYSDGITDNGTAALIEPYLQEGYGGTNGLNYFDADRLAEYVTALERVGFTFNIHALGDQGVRDALDAIETAQAVNTDITDTHHRLTHVELVHPDDLARFEELGVIADLQVAGEIALPENREFLRELIGDRVDDMLPAGSLLDAGATVVFSSDFDVNDPSPFVGIFHALSRTDGEAFDNIMDAIRAYTIDAAYALGHDDLVGSLEVGKRADLVVLDQDLFSISLDQIPDTAVLLTLLDGEAVHGTLVPEPAGELLICMALIGLFAIRRGRS